MGILARRMERLIVELESSEERLEEAIDMRGLNNEMELIAMGLITEPGVQEATRVLSKHHGCAHASEAISAALEGLRSST